ncbi:hypothetical protein HKX48_009466 [Thoreauomyces humboldtii]|nr:hypothetical protein HKX48_009466 [Thoreauomyces humboldtii]
MSSTFQQNSTRHINGNSSTCTEHQLASRSPPSAVASQAHPLTASLRAYLDATTSATLASTDAREVCVQLDRLRAVAGCLASERVQEDSLDVHRDREIVRSIFSVSDALFRSPGASARLRTGCLRVFSLILSPISGVKVRNPVFSLAELIPLLDETVGLQEGFLPKLIEELQSSSAPHVQFYALKILLRIGKFVHFTEAVWKDGTSALLAMLNAMPSSSSDRAVDGVPLLAVSLMLQLLREGLDSLFVERAGELTTALLTAVREMACSANNEKVERQACKSILVLYLLFKRKPLTIQLYDAPSIAALIRILDHRTCGRSMAVFVATGSSEEPEMFRDISQLLLAALNQPCTNLPEIQGHALVAAAASYIRMLSASRPSVFQVLPAFDLLLVALPRSTEVHWGAGSTEDLPWTLLKLWATISTSEYARKFDLTIIESLKGKMLKAITFLVGDASGLALCGTADPQHLVPFLRELGQSTRKLLSSCKEEPCSARSAHNAPVDTSPGLGLRSLRLLSVLMGDKAFRLKLVAEGVLGDLLDINHAEILLRGPPGDGRTAMLLLFSVLQQAADNSSIRFKMRDGILWGETATESGNDDAPAVIPLPARPKSDFTVIHFCVQLFVSAAALTRQGAGRSQIHLDKVMQRAMNFLTCNYGHDASVAAVLCACPLSMFGTLQDVIPSSWIQKRGAANMVSVFPVIIDLVTADIVSHESDRDIEAEQDAARVEASRLAAAGVLDSLVGLGMMKAELLASDTLSRLANALTPEDEDTAVSKILLRVLGRLIAAPDLLHLMIANCGFSALFELLLIKEHAEPGHGERLLQAFGKVLAKDHNEIGKVIVRLFDFHSVSRNGVVDPASAVFREKIAIGLAYACGPSILTTAVAGQTSYKDALELLFRMARRGGPLDQDEDAMVPTGFAGLHMTRAVWALTYVDHVCPSLTKDVLPGPVNDGPDRGEAIVNLFQTDLVPSKIDDDIVHFEFPEEPNAHRLTCGRKTLAAASLALRAMLYGEYVEAHQQVIQMRDVSSDTWELLIAYFSHPRPVSPSSTHLSPYMLRHLRRAAQLAECADRFLCEDLVESCMAYLYSGALDAARWRDGPRAEWLRDWATGWSGGMAGREWIARIDDVTFKGMAMGLRALTTGMRAGMEDG